MFRTYIETTKTNRTVLKQTEKIRNKPKLSEKNTKVSNCFVALLFVSVQSKHRNSLLQYRSETTETNILFQIVLKLVLVSFGSSFSCSNQN